MKLFPFLLATLMLVGITTTSCNNDDDKDDENIVTPCGTTWDSEVQAIIQTSCAYSGCHSGGSTANEFIPEASNDYTSYAAIKANLDNGTFEKRALIDKNMPNPMFVPAGNPTELSQEELELLQCWADADFPEN
ncbi:MAG: hypothetical protein AB8G15_05045 [Saprospiraceae bacterium]